MDALGVSAAVDSFAADLAAALCLTAAALMGLAAKEAGLASKNSAASGERATKHKTDLARGVFMALLSNAKLARGSSDSAENQFTVKVSKRDRVAELPPTMTLTVPESTSQPLPSLVVLSLA